MRLHSQQAEQRWQKVIPPTRQRSAALAQRAKYLTGLTGTQSQNINMEANDRVAKVIQMLSSSGSECAVAELA